jgi:two-component system, NtrC family, sensor kinase
MNPLSNLAPDMKTLMPQPAALPQGGAEPVAEQRVFSVRVKGTIVLMALIAYAMLIVIFIFHQKTLLLRDFDAIQYSLEVDGSLKQADTAAFHAVTAVFINTDAADPAAGMQRIKMHFQLLRSRHADLLMRMPGVAVDLEAAETAMGNATAKPTRENMNILVSELVRVKDDYAVEAERTHQTRQRMSAQFRTQTDTVAMTTLLLGMMGLGLLGAITGLFFRRLTEDLGTLQTRALEIVRGYRGDPLPIRRHDEVGQLMRAVNSMATALDKREKELIVERQKYFHQEKMAAIGTLAAGVAHEIGNPIAAIAGIAQEIADRRTGCGMDVEGGCRADLIRAQTDRLAAITREISEFSSPQAVEPQLLDLNAQLRSASNLLRYDRRLRPVDLKLDLDPQLPAIHGVADQVTQVIMNLLINAVDALEDVPEGSATISIETRLDGGRVRMSVGDNGRGMEPHVLAHAFEAFYTTKAAGKGTGLGLSLCYSIMQSHGGSIEIESEAGNGTRVIVDFPLAED